MPTTSMQQALNIWRCRAQVAGALSGLWLLDRWAGPIEPSADLHRFFVDRYLRLTNYHRARGRHDRAKHCFAKAVLHWRAIGLDEPPPAAATVMPVPLPPIVTWAVATDRVGSDLRKAA
ncbi:MAG: hypothetical protein ACLPKB_08505 [Xanthobacteraceae bacterium]